MGGLAEQETELGDAGGGFMNYGFRLGDYSTNVIDPSDGMTFWAANEYIGNDGANDLWLTHITSFTAK